MKQWQAVKQRWQRLARREQFILCIGGIAVLFFIIYQFIYVTYQHHIDNLELDIANQQELLAWMQDAQQKIQTLKTSTHKGQDLGQKSLLAAVADSIKESALKPNHIEQAANDKVTVKFDNVSFDQMIQWLMTVWDHYSIEVSQLTVESKAAPGMVEANLVLEVKR